MRRALGLASFFGIVLGSATAFAQPSEVPIEVSPMMKAFNKRVPHDDHGKYTISTKAVGKGRTLIRVRGMQPGQPSQLVMSATVSPKGATVRVGAQTFPVSDAMAHVDLSKMIGDIVRKDTHVFGSQARLLRGTIKQIADGAAQGSGAPRLWRHRALKDAGFTRPALWSDKPAGQAMIKRWDAQRHIAPMPERHGPKPMD